MATVAGNTNFCDKVELIGVKPKKPVYKNLNRGLNDMQTLIQFLSHSEAFRQLQSYYHKHFSLTIFFIT